MANLKAKRTRDGSQILKDPTRYPPTLGTIRVSKLQSREAGVEEYEVSYLLVSSGQIPHIKQDP